MIEFFNNIVDFANEWLMEEFLEKKDAMADRRAELERKRQKLAPLKRRKISLEVRNRSIKSKKKSSNVFSA